MKAKSKKGIFSSLCVGAMCLSALFSANLSATHTAFASALSKESNAYLENVYTDGTNKYLKAIAGVSADATNRIYTMPSTGTTPTRGDTLFFKYEPIVWQVLSYDSTNSRALVVSNKILANMAFQPTYSSNYTTANGGDGTTTKANDYTYSNIRYWLNGYTQKDPTGSDTNYVSSGTGGVTSNRTLNYGISFYDTAFSTSEQNKILSTTLTTTSDNTDKTTYVSGTFNQSSPTSADKIFLLSRNDVSKTYYSSNASIQKTTTDYAASQGAYNYYSESYKTNTGTGYNGYWWLRSPYSSSSNGAYYVYSGGIVSISGVKYVHIGVVPALYLNPTGVTFYTTADCTTPASASAGTYVQFGSYPQTVVNVIQTEDIGKTLTDENDNKYYYQESTSDNYDYVYINDDATTIKYYTKVNGEYADPVPDTGVEIEFASVAISGAILFGIMLWIVNVAKKPKNMYN